MTQINLEELGTEEKTDGRGLVGADRQHEHSRARSAERRDLRKASPEVMRTFSDMARAAHDGEALDGKTKELVALAIGVAVHCSPCIAYHAEGAVKQGASQAEVAETLAMAIYMGAGPSVMYAAQALEAVGQMAAKASKPA